MNDLTISHLQSLLPRTDTPNPNSSEDASETPFSDYIKQSIEEVNDKMLEADLAIDDLVTGKNQDIHKTMIAMQKADVSFELVMQIRNKIISAYDEIRRMTI